MKWESKDMDVYLTAKEYVDTAVLPLLPVSFGEDMKQVVGMGEFISLLMPQLEKQFKGRIFLLPQYPYLKTSEEGKRISDLHDWVTHLRNHGFKHIFFITSDSDWKAGEDKLNGELIWLPSIPLENMEEKYKRTILEEQVKQLLQLIIQKWQNN